MQLMMAAVRFLFGLFLIYTLVYILQWIAGMVCTVKRLSGFQERRHLIRSLLPDDMLPPDGVTAIIPAHNEKKCISATVHSLLGEDFPNLKIVVVDDGSTDGTAEQLIHEFQLLPELDHRESGLPTRHVHRCYRRTIAGRDLLLIRKQNGGKSDALNCGLNYCRSPYCLILDADTQIERGATRLLLSAFLTDPRTIVCAGTVRNSNDRSSAFRHLGFFQKWLVRFQVLEYYRTFYMQRILFDKLNANIIVSGAFAMFDAELVRAVGGYQTGIIGEDMELTMRLHAFCHAQERPYRIAVMPEARCRTQVPFQFRDFYNQRRRWHIGMIQSLKRHIYMVGSRHYGWAGVISGSFVLLYELLAPFIELAGLATLAAAFCLEMVPVKTVLVLMGMYAIMILLTQSLFLGILKADRVEPVTFRSQLQLVVVSIAELLIFHPLNLVIKLNAFATRNKNGATWGKIQRSS